MLRSSLDRNQATSEPMAFKTVSQPSARDDVRSILEPILRTIKQVQTKHSVNPGVDSARDIPAIQDEGQFQSAQASSVQPEVRKNLATQSPGINTKSIQSTSAVPDVTSMEDDEASSNQSLLISSRVVSPVPRTQTAQDSPTQYNPAASVSPQNRDLPRVLKADNVKQNTCLIPDRTQPDSHAQGPRARSSFPVHPWPFLARTNTSE